MQNTIFITYLTKFLYHFDELSSHTTVALAQPQSQIVYSPSKCRSGKINSIMSSLSITCISQLTSSTAQLVLSQSFSAQFSKLTPDKTMTHLAHEITTNVYFKFNCCILRSRS